VTARERWTTGRKAFLLGALCLLAAGGGVFAAVAPGAAHAAGETEAASAERTPPGLAAPVVVMKMWPSLRTDSSFATW
jgi:hypothetical protein